MQRMNDEQEALIVDNIRLAYFIAQKWTRQLPPQKLDPEDLKSLCTYGLCKAARAFDKDKGVKFATFAARCMDNEVLMTLRKEKNDWRTTSLEQPINVDQDGNALTILDVVSDPKDHIEQWLIFETIPTLLNALPDRDRTMMERIYFGEETQRTVGNDMGLSQSYVSRIRNKALTQMKKEAMKDNIAWF